MAKFGSNFLLDKDIYGQEIGLLYKGKSQYQTRLGAPLTLATYILVTVYLTSKVRFFFEKSGQVENFNKIKVDLFDEDTVYMNQTDMLIGLNTRFPVPPSIGLWKARRLEKVPGSVYEMQGFEVEMVNCDSIKDEMEDYFIKRLGQEIFDFNYQTARCLKDNWMNGDQLQTDFQTIEIYFEHCKTKSSTEHCLSDEQTIQFWTNPYYPMQLNVFNIENFVDMSNQEEPL